jgi:hypothetical protein
MTDEEKSPTEGRGWSRRTIVQGAAWSVPVIAAAVATPMAAASVAGTVEFVNGPYSVTACGTLGDVVVQATTDGTAPVPAGTMITVTLPSGLTWEDGSSGSRVLPANGNGRVTLSGLQAGPAAGNPVITASAAGADAAAPVSVAAAAGPFGFYAIRNGATANGPFPGVPLGATAVGDRYFLTSDGTLLYTEGGAVETIATGVTAADMYVTPDLRFIANYATSEGGFYVVRGAAVFGGPFPNVPADSTPLGDRYWLTPDGTFLYSDGVTTETIATGVTDANGYVTPDGRYIADYVTSAGAFYVVRNGATFGGQFPGVPAGSTSMGDRYFLTPDGALMYATAEGSEVIATGVTDASAYVTPDGRYVADYVTSAGAFYVIRNGQDLIGPFPGVPAGSTPLGDRYFLTANGELLYSDGASAETVATGVTSASTSILNDGRYIVNYVVGGC